MRNLLPFLNLNRRTIVLGATAFVSALAASALISCKVGPNYERPQLEVPTTFKSAATEPTTGPAAHLASDWWKMFNDPTLNALEAQALANNQTIKAAVARVLNARATAQVTRSEFYPTVTFDPAITRARSSANLGSGGTSSGGHTRTDYRVPIDMTYEVDVWGRVRRAYESSKAQLQASADDFQVVLQTMETDLAIDYFNLRSFEIQHDIVERNVHAYDQQVTLLQKQQSAGLVGKLDVLQAMALRDSTKATAIDLQRQRDSAEHAIAVLIGKPPAQVTILPAQAEVAVPTIPPAIPAELLRRRPDVAEAEQNLIAANANIGVATANFYPVFTISGAAGFESVNIQHLADWQSRLWSLGPNVTFPLFEGGRLRAELEQSRQQYNEFLANYRQQVLVAFQDVEDALSNMHYYTDESEANEVAIASSEEYLRLSNIQYRNGLVNYITVIDAERTLFTNQLQGAQIDNSRLVSAVQLIKALGGGWDAHSSASTQPAVPYYDPVSATRP